MKIPENTKSNTVRTTRAADWLLSVFHMGRLAESSYESHRQLMEGIALSPKVCADESRVDRADIHGRSSQWGIEFVLWFLDTGIGIQESRECHLDAFNQEALEHLAHCWDETDCQLIRELINGTDLYDVEHYRLYFARQLAQIGIGT